MDDTPDKVRRNLLVYCAAVLIGWYLDVDAKTFVVVPGVEVKTLDPVKVSIVAFTTLLYLMLRFSYSQEYIDGSDYFKAAKQLPHDYLLKYLKEAIKSYDEHGREGALAGIFDWNAFDERIKTYHRLVRGGEVVKILINISELDRPGADNVGYIGIQCLRINKAGELEQFRDDFLPSRIYYKLPIAMVRQGLLLSIWRMFAADNKFIVAKLPMLLAVVTYIYLLFKMLSLALARSI